MSLHTRLFLTLTLLALGADNLYSQSVRQSTPQRVRRGVSGSYESAFTIGIDTAGTLTGWFENFTGWDEQTKSPRFSCAFFMYGTFQDSLYRITTWFPGETEKDGFIPGTASFKLENGKPALRVHLEREHGGCWNVFPLSELNQSSLPLLTRGTWQGVRVVKSTRAYFHSQPESASQGKAYCVAGDAVRVYAEQTGWAECGFQGKKLVRGWLKVSDLHSPTPP